MEESAEGTMGGVMVEGIPDKEEATAGNSAANNPAPLLPAPEEEKLLPAGTESEKIVGEPAPSAPLDSIVFDAIEKVPENSAAQAVPSQEPPILQAMDKLYTGNAVLAAQGKTATPTEETEYAPIDRSLRESGLKEALPHQEHAEPPREAFASQEKSGLPKIHTYADDMGKEIQKRGATISSIITAEKARAPVKEPKPQRNLSANLFIIGAATLAVLGVGAVATVIFLARSAPPIAPPPVSLIPVNHRANIPVDPQVSLSETLARAKVSAAIQLGEVEEFDVTQGGTALSATDILTALGAPNALARNATGILIGVHSFDHAQPFILVSVSAYDSAFAAMLVWEKTIGDNLGDFFAPPGIQPGGVTTHPPPLSFTDHVAANLDVRESQNNWPVWYAFPRQDLLLITTNESTLREVLTRLSLQKSQNQ